MLHQIATRLAGFALAATLFLGGLACGHDHETGRGHDHADAPTHDACACSCHAGGCAVLVVAPTPFRPGPASLTYPDAAQDSGTRLIRAIFDPPRA